MKPLHLAALAGAAAAAWYLLRDDDAEASANAGVEVLAAAAAPPRPATPDDLVSPALAAVLNVPFPSEAQARWTVERAFPGSADRFNYVQDAFGLWRVASVR